MRGFFSKMLFLILAGICGLIFPQNSLADPVEIKLAVVTKSGSAQNIAAEKFKELIEARSNNEIQVTLYHSGSLGTETEILQHDDDVLTVLPRLGGGFHDQRCRQ